MRPRFSIRTLLVLTALVAGSCYWWIEGPSATAREFARHVAAKDYRAASFMFASMSNIRIIWGDHIQRVEIHDRDWSDFLHRRRRISLHYNYSDGQIGAHPIVTTSSDVRPADWRDHHMWPHKAN
jgi:hypothetical protein